jgi:hypothetical protein
VVEQGIAFRVELAALFVPQRWDPDRVVFIQPVGQVEEGGEVLFGGDRVDAHGGLQMVLLILAEIERMAQ